MEITVEAYGEELSCEDFHKLMLEFTRVWFLRKCEDLNNLRAELTRAYSHKDSEKVRKEAKRVALSAVCKKCNEFAIH